MAGNKNLNKAKDNKKDEWYTQLSDIEEELKHYKEHFKGKTILCNCDDPYESNFFKYFAMNFNQLKLKKLLATCYGTSPIMYTQLSFLEEDTAYENLRTGKKPYKVEITEVKDENGDGAIDLADVEILLRNKKNVLTELKGDGDFRSDECIELLKQADIVVTNPPFSLIKEYICQLIEYKKDYIILGDMNIIKYKEIFPLFQANKMYAGYGFNKTMVFQSPYKNTLESNRTYVKNRGYDPDKFIKRPKNCWYTNFEISKHMEKLPLYKKYSPDEYHKYDNYNAIEVPNINDIPCDYDGLMGVPISFLGKYNPKQFEIVGASDLSDTLDGIVRLGEEWIEAYRSEGGTGHYTANMKSLAYSAEGKHKIIFSRLIIRRK